MNYLKDVRDQNMRRIYLKAVRVGNYILIPCEISGEAEESLHEKIMLF